MRCIPSEPTVLGALVLMLVWMIPTDDTRAQAAATVTLGRDTYEEFCGVCHGYDGAPLLPGAPAFAKGERLEQSDTVLLKSISQGKGDLMPAWQDILSEEERVAILVYVRSMAAAAASGEN